MKKDYFYEIKKLIRKAHNISCEIMRKTEAHLLNAKAHKYVSEKKISAKNYETLYEDLKKITGIPKFDLINMPEKDKAKIIERLEKENKEFHFKSQYLEEENERLKIENKRFRLRLDGIAKENIQLRRDINKEYIKSISQ